ncbi:MAG: hypothetical protein JWQ02_621 [Capsulimonas sp.]|jgi:hypothetical protein|nr:hypothetical protein [Capsulimonas sp.]
MPYQGLTAAIVSGISILFVVTLWAIGLAIEKDSISKNHDDTH